MSDRASPRRAPPSGSARHGSCPIDTADVRADGRSRTTITNAYSGLVVRSRRTACSSSPIPTNESRGSFHSTSTVTGEGRDGQRSDRDRSRSMPSSRRSALPASAHPCASPVAHNVTLDASRAATGQPALPCSATAWSERNVWLAAIIGDMRLGVAHHFGWAVAVAAAGRPPCCRPQTDRADRTGRGGRTDPSRRQAAR